MTIKFLFIIMISPWCQL